MKKRIISLLLAMMMLFSVTTNIEMTAYAALSKTQNDAVTWVKSQIGKSIEFNDSNNLYQCVDFVQAYYNYLGLPINTGSAYTYASYTLPNNMTRINYYSGFEPRPGDIGVWKDQNHIGVFTSSTEFVDQNSNYRSYVASNSSLSSIGLSMSSMTCIIRPNFANNNSSIETPTISVSRDYYYVGDTVKINWVATSSDADFYQYWLIIKNTTTNKQYYGGSADSYQNPSKNYYNFTIPEAGNYYITVYSVPNDTVNNKQKYDTYTITANKKSMSTPTISLNKNQFCINEIVNISWNATAMDTDFYQYWLVIRNTTKGVTYYSASADSYQNPSKNYFNYRITEAGNYKITVYAVPYYDKNGREKFATYDFSVNYSHLYDDTIVKAPTYTNEGYVTYVCSTCGDTYTEEIPKLEQVLSGWVAENGKWAYYVNGSKVVNDWMLDSVGWCYLGSDGYMVTNQWIMDTQGWCYVGADGYCVTDCWMKDSIGWCYLDSEGRMATNQWILDSVGWCYVGADGYCVTNSWMQDSIGWCYLDADGRMVYNTYIRDSKGLCYIDSNGYWNGKYL